VIINGTELTAFRTRPLFTLWPFYADGDRFIVEVWGNGLNTPRCRKTQKLSEQGCVLQGMDSLFEARSYHTKRRQVTHRPLKCRKNLEKWHRFAEIQRMYLSNEVHKQFGNSANYFELMGRRAIVENNNEKAEELFQQSLSKNPNQIRAKQELADLYMNRGSIKEALRVYLELHNANPRHPERAAKIADCYFKLGQIKDADSICSQAVSLDQFSQIVRENLAVTRMAFGDYESVKNLIKTGVDANSFARQLNSIGINLVKAGRYDESIEHYKKAQDLLPNNNVQHLLLLNIGIAYAKWGKFAEAKQYAELALVEQPDYQKSYSTSEGSWSSIRKD